MQLCLFLKPFYCVYVYVCMYMYVCVCVCVCVCVSGCGQFGETPVSARSEKAHNVHTAYMLWKWCPWFTHSVARLEMIVI